MTSPRPVNFRIGIVADTGVNAEDERERGTVLVALRAAALTGGTVATVSAATRLDAQRVEQRLAELVADGRALRLATPATLIAADIASDLLARAVERLRDSQLERPWLAGVTSLRLAQVLTVDEPALFRVLATYVRNGQLSECGGYYATTDYVPQLTAEQQAFFDELFASSDQGRQPVELVRLQTRVRSSAVVGLSGAFDTLVAIGVLTRVAGSVYHGSRLAAIRAQLEATLHRQGHITVADFRTVTGTTRKYAVPLLEFFDASGVTMRSGDVRVLRS